MRPLTRRLAAAINRTDGVNGVPFASRVAMTPRTRERWTSWVHYGVMAPGLPEPHRWFGVMAILGTPGARCFDNDPWIRTTPRDTAYVVAGTATTGEAAFRTYAMAGECELREDGTLLRFGAGDLVLEGAAPHVTVRRGGPQPVELELDVTDKVAYFSRVPGVYDHWSLLARYRGTVAGAPVAGLCTYEYARGAGPYSVARGVVPAWAKAPIAAFTYQVLDLGEERQLLLTVAGPRWGAHLHEGAWERGLHDHGAMHRDVTLTVTAHRPEPLTTPDGRRMRMPAAWTWTVRDAAGARIGTLDCRAGDDWVYGLGAGYVGSFTAAGDVHGRRVDTRGYVEWVDVTRGGAA